MIEEVLSGSLEIDKKSITESLESLEEIKEIPTRDTVKKSFKEAAQYIAKGGKRRLRERLIEKKSENLIKGIGYKAVKKDNGYGSYAGFKRPKGNIGWIIDLGTTQRRTKKGYNRGMVKPTHFWTDTKKEDAPKALEMVKESIDNAVQELKSRYKT